MLLENILRDQCALNLARPVLAGISGGPDSLCLLGVLHACGYRVIVAHFNHKLRPEAEVESVAVAERARALGLPFVTDSSQVATWARERSLSIEEAARILRYQFLFSAARQAGAQAVAVGHTADDQAETVLMHFLRGAGIAGLKGMEHRTLLPLFDDKIPLIRPLLSLWRADTEAYCRENGLRPHYDASNADETYFRNRLRHALLPELEKYNPRIKETLVRTAQALQGDAAILEADLDALWEKALTGSGEGWLAFSQPVLAGSAPGSLRNLFRRAGELLRPGSRDIGFAALERAAGFVRVPAGKQVDFINGLYLFAENGTIHLAAYEADLAFVQWPQLDQSMEISTPCLDAGNGWILSVEEVSPDAEDWRLNADGWSAWLDADRAVGRLTLRPRREGDVFHPLGMAGQTVKLREFFINVKIPNRARQKWPLVCSGDDIVWIPGFRIAHPFRVTEKTRRVLKLALKKDRADT